MGLIEMLANDPILKTFWSPWEEVFCEQVSPKAFLNWIPLLIQCGLLYPYFDRFSSIRWLRLAIMPVNVYCGLRFSVGYCYKPLSRRATLNLMHGCSGIVNSMKTLEWGLARNSHEAKLWRRPEFPRTDPNAVVSKESDEPNIQERAPFKLRDWLLWTTELWTSPRGFQYGWGARASPNTRSAAMVLKRMYKVNVAHVLTTTFALLCREHGSATKALHHLGIPSFIGLTLLAEGIYTLAFGFYLVSITDLIYSYHTLLAHLIHYLNSFFHFPSFVLEFFDLKLYIPWYNYPHSPTSLTQLWGKAWHQNFRRCFLFCGGLPAGKIAKFVGFSSTAERLAILWGSFFISGIMHEFAIHFIARKPHPNPHILFHEFPGSFIYFFVQPIGILIEPYVIPFIPGGGLVWTYLFTLLSATPFRTQYLLGYRFLDASYPEVSFKWFLTSLLIPGFTSRG
ncbi:hypothetical protein O181_026708 [Austropuccinia psidii MF-1]|uniref:Wax synthase domain-containing protein n=1 Tax=Austropuccinia psidii MF-1 TaxID=1389203 RepID=A0A9Q3CN36_9BASI|nr:hypothetical protein [Austropuccinia psidii MF-1]